MTSYSSTRNKRNHFRIIAGEWRSRKLAFPGDVESLRPTTDRIRETLFNWLQQKIPGARCLDLFAGSGALAFEACSRHAAHVTAIDSSARVTDMIRENCRLVQCSTMEVITADSMQWLEKQSGEHLYDIVFLDPPYSKNLLSQCFALLESGNYLAPEGIVYLESDSSLERLSLPSNWQLLRSKKAGQVYFGVCAKTMN